MNEGQKPLINQVLSLSINDLSRGGMGIGRYLFENEDKERVIFVPQTMPGDTVEVRITEIQKRFLSAELLRVLTPSAQRVTPQCKVFGQCGGCEWQHIPYSMQFETKVNGALHALKRTAVKFESAQIHPYPAAQIYHYRNRIQLRTSGEENIGFYARGSRKLVPISRCEIADELINQSLQGQVKGELKQKFIQHPELKEHKVEIQVHPLQWKWDSPHASMGFRQVNEEQNRNLQAFVSDRIADGAYILDLYGGSGNLSLHLAHRVKWVECVDLYTASNEMPNKPKNLSFSASDVSKWLTRKVYEKEKGYSKIEGNIQAILDPPREGIAEQQHKIAKALETLGASTLIMVGCEVDAWARDLARFQSYGWKLQKLAFLDFFPHTHHLESVGVMIKE